MDGIIDHLGAAAEAAMNRCTQCGKCVEACPTAAHIGMDKSRSAAIAGELVALTRDGTPGAEALQWINACNGSGNCSAACPEGINVRQWVGVERLKQRVANRAAPDRTAAAQRKFRSMSHSVRLLASMQMPQAALDRIQQSRRDRTVDLVFYTGCNVLRTPHLVFNVMDILDGLGFDYEVMGGASHCCGVYHFMEGDLPAYSKVSGHTYDAFAKVGAKRVLTWCPSCTKQFGEVWHDYAKPEFEMGHVTKFLVEQLDRIRPKFRADLPLQRVAIHEHQGIDGVAQGVRTLLQAIPNLELVEIEQDSTFNYACGGPMTRHNDREQEIHRIAAENAAAAGIDVLVTMYHSCHRALAGAEAHYPFAVKNFTDLLAEAMGGGGRHDYYKQYKRGGEMTEAVAAAKTYLEQNGVALDAETLKTLTAEIFAEEGIAGTSAGFAAAMTEVTR
jgi:heterodisulfide reductase subunit D